MEINQLLQIAPNLKVEISAKDLQTAFQQWANPLIQKAINKQAIRNNDEWLTKKQATQYLHCSMRTIENFIVRGQLKKHTAGNRVLLNKQELNQLLNK